MCPPRSRVAASQSFVQSETGGIEEVKEEEAKNNNEHTSMSALCFWFGNVCWIGVEVVEKVQHEKHLGKKQGGMGGLRTIVANVMISSVYIGRGVCRALQI